MEYQYAESARNAIIRAEKNYPITISNTKLHKDLGAQDRHLVVLKLFLSNIKFLLTRHLN